MNYYTNSQAPLRNPAGGIKALDIPAGHRVEGFETVPLRYANQDTEWRRVQYSNGLRSYAGFVYAGLLDRVTEKYSPVLTVPFQTVNPQDAAQYMVYLSNVQYNLCGEFCVVYCVAPDMPVDAFLEGWKVKAPSFFNRIFNGGKSRGTDLGDLDSMLAALGREIPSARYNVALRDPVLGRPIVTPERVKALLEDNFIISSCHISGLTGSLRGSGILHWVVLESIEIEDVGRARVTLYNPFVNKLQEYSWAELVGSMGQPYGVLVERNN